MNGVRGVSRQCSRALVFIFGLTVLLLAAARADAAPIEAKSFAGLGRGPGEVTQPGGIAVSPDGTRVFVADTENQRIDEFAADGNEGGAFRRAWGWGVEDGSPELQTCTSETGCLRGLTGLGLGELNEPVGVAVDTAGDVYAVNRARGDGRVQKFDTSGEEVAYAGRLPAAYGKGGGGKVGFTFPLPATNDVAVGSDGTVYVADDAEAGPRVVAFDPVTKASRSIPVAIGRITAIAAVPGGLYVGGQSGELVSIEGGAEAARYETGLPEITALSYDQRSGNLLVEPVDYETEPSGKTVAVRLREVALDGQVLATIRVPGIQRPGDSRPDPFGLAVDPQLQIEPSYRGSYAPGAIFIGAPYTEYSFESRIRVLAELVPGKPISEAVPFVTPGTETASVSAGVDAQGNDTHVYFEYGTTTAYGSFAPAPPGADIGSAFGAQTVYAQLTGLAPNTTYHVAVVATNSAGTVVGPDRTFITYAAVAPFALPDERVWEQVTTEKGTGILTGSPNVAQATPDGDAVAFATASTLPGAQGGFITSSYAAFRSASGWQTKSLSLPRATRPEQTLDDEEALSENLKLTIGRTDTALTGDAPIGTNLFLRDVLTGQTTLLTPRPAGVDGSFGRPVGSADLSRVFFTADGRLTSDTPADAGTSLYEWSGGALHDVGILPGSDTPTSTNIELPVFGSDSPAIPGLVSTDGRRVFFGATPPGAEASQIFARVDGSRTAYVSASRKSSPEAEAPRQRAFFEGASADGRYAFFTSSAELTDDANTGEAPEGEENGLPRLKESPNVYRYDVDTGQLLDLSVATEPADAERGAAVFSGVVIAANGRSAYFVAQGKLAAGGTSGEPNLYRWSEAGGVQFVATLSDANFERRNARTTIDGSKLAFVSSRALDPRYPEANGSQIFLYSTVDGSITCVTCGPIRGGGDAQILGGSHVFSADGSRFFFQTATALTAADTNERIDVYEWEGGEAHLISSGTSQLDSTLIDASASGDDVFFVTVGRLARTDRDEQTDVYDARVRGGFPTAPEATPCEGEECRPSAGAAPAGPTIGSASVNGPPNPKHRRHHRKKHRKHKHRKKHRKQVKAKRSQGRAAVGKGGVNR